jgi:phenylpropionate dioxygenase-like ring-hydroxylating dioxygenase large terminal subunit
MLSHERNELLVRVGENTRAGNFFRKYWLPIFPSGDLEADGQPKRVRLLGEDLVIFRATDGKVGLLDSRCPHRRAPMFFGRNEECGLRCVYHGWKFGIDGGLKEMANERDDSRYKDRLHIKSYPCVERSGVVWAYMGSERDNPPPLPELEWNLLPAERVHVTFRVQESNWLQALEGDIDSSHAQILHGRVGGGGELSSHITGRDKQPVFETLQQPFGVTIAARRQASAENYYWRITQFVMPFLTMVGPHPTYPEITGHMWVPMDDEHTLVLTFSFHPSEPLPEKTLQIWENGYKGRDGGHMSKNGTEPRPNEPYAAYWSKWNRGNQFLFDYELQQTWNSGLPGLWVQDAGVQAALDPIIDRTKEHLCASDVGVVAVRRKLLEAIEAMEKGVTPETVSQPELSRVRAASLTLPISATWQEAGQRAMFAPVGADWGYVP